MTDSDRAGGMVHRGALKIQEKCRTRGALTPYLVGRREQKTAANGNEDQ